jgi:hypothetical protein
MCKIIQFIDVIPITFIQACIQNVYHSIFLKVHRFIYMQLKFGTIPLDYANFSTLKKKVMSSSHLSFLCFFANQLWKDSMVSWA